MRVFLFILISFFLTISLVGQNTKEMLAEINGKWTLDDNGNVNIVKVIEASDLKKEDIYNRILTYFTYHYVSGKSLIQVQDKEQGLLVGKGLFEKVHIGGPIPITYIDVWHVLRVEVKDGKARVILSLIGYEKKITQGNLSPEFGKTKIADEYPINKKGTQKKLMSKAFYYAYQKAYNTIVEIEEVIKEDKYLNQTGNSDW